MIELRNNNIPPSPCKDCSDRYLGCHAECIKYIDFKQRSEVVKQMIADEKTFEANFYSVKRKAGIRSLKKKKK